MIEKFRKIFAGLEERFGYHQIDTSIGDGKKSGTSFTSSYAHTEEMWKAHLEGTKFDMPVLETNPNPTGLPETELSPGLMTNPFAIKI